jgi:hypothetical protein
VYGTVYMAWAYGALLRSSPPIHLSLRISERSADIECGLRRDSREMRMMYLSGGCCEGPKVKNGYRYVAFLSFAISMFTSESATGNKIPCYYSSTECRSCRCSRFRCLEDRSSINEPKHLFEEALVESSRVDCRRRRCGSSTWRGSLCD